MVPTEAYKVDYPGRTDTGPYPITFSATLDDGGDAEDIVVKLLDSTSVETDITSVCTVVGMNVYTTASYAATYTVVIIRYPDITQPSSFSYGTAFPSKTVENCLDRLTFIAQRLQLDSDQSLKVPLSEEETGRLPIISERANKYLAFNAEGLPIASGVAIGSATVTAFMETVLDDATSSDARTTLGVPTLSDDYFADIGSISNSSQLSSSNWEEILFYRLTPYVPTPIHLGYLCECAGNALFATKTTTGTSAGKLVCATGDFVANGVVAGDLIWNVTDKVYGCVTARDSATELSVDNDVFPTAKGFVIWHKPTLPTYIKACNGADIVVGHGMPQSLPNIANSYANNSVAYYIIRIY